MTAEVLVVQKYLNRPFELKFLYVFLSGKESRVSEENPPSDHVTADLIGEDRLMLEDNATSVTINTQEGEDNHLRNQIPLEKSDASRLLSDIPEEFQIEPEATEDDWMQPDMTGDIQGEIEWEDFIG